MDTMRQWRYSRGEGTYSRDDQKSKILHPKGGLSWRIVESLWCSYKTVQRLVNYNIFMSHALVMEPCMCAHDIMINSC